MEISKTADNALVVLIAIADGSSTASSIARTTGLNRTVVHRMLATLHARGFARRAGGEYLVGPAMLRFAQSIDVVLRGTARPHMVELSESTGETVILSVRDQYDALVVEQVVGRKHPTRVEQELGSRRPLTRGAGQRAILAFLDDQTIERFLSVDDNRKDLAAKLQAIALDGYAMSQNELRSDVHGVSAPILLEGKAVASISLLVPSSRGSALNDLVQKVLDAASKISDELATPQG